MIISKGHPYKIYNNYKIIKQQQVSKKLNFVILILERDPSSESDDVAIARKRNLDKNNSRIKIKQEIESSYSSECNYSIFFVYKDSITIFS